MRARPENVERWGWYSIGINVVLATINLVVALASGSLAVQAEMVHNLVDFLTAVAVLIGLKLSTRKTRAPCGLYKLENVITVGLAVMIFVTAYEISVRLEDGAVAERCFVPNLYVEEDRAKGIRVAEWLVGQEVDVVFLKESLRGKGPVYVFGDAGVETRETEAGTLEEALEDARKEDTQ